MDKDLTAVESIPHVCNRVCMNWGTAELDVYINALVMDSRDGARKGLPMAVGDELVWLVKVNQWRRALDIQERLNIGLPDAHAKVQMEDDALSELEASGDPLSGGGAAARRYSDKAAALRPRRRHEENTLFGIVVGAVTNKYSLLAIVAILTLKALWPTIKVLFELIAT